MMNQSNQTIQAFMSDLPDLVSPVELAHKLHLHSQSIYQKIKKQEENPELNLLPPPFRIPGNTKVFFIKQDVIDWLLRGQQEKSTPVNQKPGNKMGRKTKREQLECVRAEGYSHEDT